MNASAAICPTCAARLEPATETCRFCGTGVDAPSSSRMPVARSVHQAVEGWASEIFGAPRDSGRLIVAIDVRDEILERVATQIVRREVFEQRQPTTRRDLSALRLTPNQVDPFAVSTAVLRADSEHVSPCGYCAGEGTCRCSNCSGAGRSRCGNCGGSGKEIKYYQKTTRLINCKTCRASGTLRCAGCGGSGNVVCGTCTGSGNQLVWLTYEQQARVVVLVSPESPVVAAYPQLSEQRFLRNEELGAFGILVSEMADGPVVLQGYRGSNDATLLAAVAGMDGRIERVNRQQYFKLAVVRRDATYAMCGTKGTVVLSGSELTPARTREAARPVHRRVYAWAGIAVALAAVTGIACSALRGSAVYFNTTNPIITVLWMVGLVLALPAVGAILRAWRPGFKGSQLRSWERWLGPAAIAVFLAMGAVAFVGRPTAAAIEQALLDGNTARARTVLDALREKDGASGEVLEADDSVRLAEAKPLVGEARLQILDSVAGRHGKSAATAAAAARTDRLAQIRSSVATRAPQGAIASIDKWFGAGWAADPEVAEARASANDAAGEQCTDDPCRLQQALLAQAAAGTTDRQQRATAAHDQLVGALATSEIANEAPLARVKRLRELGATAAKTLEVAKADGGAAEQARKTALWAAAERAKVPLMGADLAVVEELLGSASASDGGKAPFIAVDGARAYVALDQQKKCRGLYVVGAEKGKRELHGTTWSNDRLLGQAVGHAASVKSPAAGTGATARWYEAGQPVVARWSGSDLIELRIGDASP